MAFRNNYSFVRKFNSDGSMTKWYQVVTLLKNNGPMRKKQILDEIWPYRAGVVDRGYLSSLFAQLNESGYIRYNSDDLCWHYIGENKKSIKKSISEYNSWGLRSPRENEWNGGTFGCGMYDKNGRYVDLWC